MGVLPSSGLRGPEGPSFSLHRVITLATLYPWYLPCTQCCHSKEVVCDGSSRSEEVPNGPSPGNLCKRVVS